MTLRTDEQASHHITQALLLTDKVNEFIDSWHGTEEELEAKTTTLNLGIRVAQIHATLSISIMLQEQGEELRDLLDQLLQRR